MISDFKPTLRNGFYAGLLVALCLGLFLLRLWNPERQVRLHTAHLIGAIEDNDWAEAQTFLDLNYRDQWDQDRILLISRLRQVLPYARHLKIESRRTIVRVSNDDGQWSGRITIEADPNEVSAMIKERVNSLDEPFQLEWRHASARPWDWKLVRVENPALELPSAGF